MKNVFQSKTIWLNLITLAVGVVALTQGIPEFQMLAPWLIFISGVLNLILRVFFTTQPLTFTNTPPNA